MELNKKLNMSNIQLQMAKLGMSQTDLASVLQVSRQAVSQWFNNESFPRPAKLLKLGKHLSLKYDELIQSEETFKPVVSFRKVAHAKTGDIRAKKAENAAYLLRLLTPYLPFDTVVGPKTLREPCLDYEYIQKAVKSLRNLMNINSEEVEVVNILDYFVQQNSILIPKLGGISKTHENAMHVYLPESGTNWVFFNLDTNLLDFKFWLTHELAHIISPTIPDSEKEEFADSLAGAFLYTGKMAEKLSEQISFVEPSRTFEMILNEARRLEISPFTVAVEYNKFAEKRSIEKIKIDRDFHARRSNFNKKYSLVSSKYFGSGQATAEKYVSLSESEFRTPIFTALRKYLAENEASPSFISDILEIPFTDSLEIYRVLRNAV